MELEFRNIEFENEEINSLIKQLNKSFNSQQDNFCLKCYTIYKIDCWFADNPDSVVKEKYNPTYYNSKQLFKTLGIKKNYKNRCIQSYLKFMTLETNRTDVGSKMKEPFFSFSPSKLFELLPYSYDDLVRFIEEGKISSDMTSKELRNTLKELTKKEEPEKSEDEKTLADEEEKWLLLKNDTMRKDFIDNYKTWGLWFEEARLKVKYYRCKIGSKVLVAICHKSFNYFLNTEEDFVIYSYLNHLGSLSYSMESVSNIIKAMSRVEDKRVYLF